MAADRPFMNGIIASGLAGIINGMQAASTDSARVINSFSESAQEDPIIPLVNLKQDEFQVKASAQVVKVGSEMTQAVLDIFA